jgi:hypothetical protein
MWPAKDSAETPPLHHAISITLRLAPANRLGGGLSVPMCCQAWSLPSDSHLFADLIAMLNPRQFLSVSSSELATAGGAVIGLRIEWVAGKLHQSHVNNLSCRPLEPALCPTNRDVSGDKGPVCSAGHSPALFQGTEVHMSHWRRLFTPVSAQGTACQHSKNSITVHGGMARLGLARLLTPSGV